MKIRIVYIHIIALAMVLLAGCSPKRNTFTSRQYHDVTAYFNVLFNGKDTYKQAVKKAEKNEPVSFDEILPVFSFEYEEVPGLVSSDMQRVIEKSKKTVEKHSITAKPKKKKNMTKEDREFYNKREFVLWIDDAYVLMGQANIFLGEYDEAVRIFEFANLEYPKEASIYTSKLWLAVIAAQQGSLASAENDLKLLEKDKHFPEKLIPTINAAWADLLIKQQKYPDAIARLEKALEKHHKKPTKIRYNYIIAQLYEKIGDKPKAQEYYDKVLKMNPPYFTAFNAQMGKAFSYDSLTQKGDIRKTLEKALNDDKNKDYKDQIYFALATVEKADNNTAKALEYYQQSIDAGGSNNRQKALAYYALATHYLAVENYIKAYRYYDSSAQNIGAGHTRYAEILGKANQLRKLAVNLEVIQNQDSLQQIAKLPVDERNKLIEQRASEAAAAEQAKKQQEEQRQSQVNLSNATRNNRETQQQTTTGGQWYFYNPTALSLGFTDFRMRWGRRKLEDNWRRRNKGLVEMEKIDEQAQSEEKLTLTETEKQKQGLTSKDKEYYLLDVPVGDEAMEESNKNILQAMYNVGEAFRDDLHNNTAAIKALEDMNLRFPNSSLQPQAYIDLYKLYTEQGNTDKAAHYKNLMAQQYPNNPQVKATLDPAFVTQLQQQAKANEDAYMNAVHQYTEGNTTQAWQMAEDVIKTQPQNPLLSQYYLLRALSANYDGNVQQYLTAMNEVIEKFPKSEVAKHASQMLADLTNKKPDEASTSTKPDEAQPQATVNYSAADGNHFFAVMVTAKGDANNLKFNIIARNADLYLNENYEVTDEDMGGGARLVLVGTFRNKAAAMKYYEDVMNKGGVFEGQPESSYTACVISDTNLFLLKGDKYFPAYYSFFQKIYMGK